MIEHNGEIIFALMFVNRFPEGVCQFVVMLAPPSHSVTMNVICCNYKLYKNQCNAPAGPRVTSRHNTDWSETCKSNFSMKKKNVIFSAEQWSRK